MRRIDDLDIKILSELAKDASISVPKLSKKINVNSSVVYSRIKRLVKGGLIKKFTIIINDRSEEHTSELQSRQYLVCRLLLEKKKNTARTITTTKETRTKTNPISSTPPLAFS